MEARCKKCGRVLRDPVSIARGMGTKCAGLSGKGGRSVLVRTHHGSGFAGSPASPGKTVAPLFTWVDNENRQKHVPDQLAAFPPELLGLVLSAPSIGTIPRRLKSHRRKTRSQKGRSPMLTVKAIRRKCINLRMLFWPGFFLKNKPLPCIPCGDGNWRIGEEGREISARDLVSYLSRYGAI